MKFVYLLLPVIAICCDEDWTQFGNYCYRRYSFIGGRNQSRFACQNVEADYVSITSEEEKDFIIDLTRTGISAPLKLQLNIGAYRDSKYSPWKWHDGTPFRQNQWFLQGGPQANELCAYLIIDPLVNASKRGSTNSRDYWFSGRTGIIVAGKCSTPEYIAICKKRDTTNGQTAKACGPTWTSLESSCYKKFSAPHIQIGNADEHCKLHGGNLVSVTSSDEKNLVIRMTRIGAPKQVNWQTAVGCYRESSNDPWKWYDGTPHNQKRFFYVGRRSDENCCMLFSDVGVFDGKAEKPTVKDLLFHYTYGNIFPGKCSFPAYQFVCEKKACDLAVSSFSGGKCVCNKGLIDITETSLLEAKKYKQGEKCVPEQCHVKQDTSIIFIIDASDSITDEHWPMLLDFVETAATKLPTKFRVGFLKFSTNISDGVWIERNWNIREFRRAIPIKYDAGDTNTPAALTQARKMFAGDRSRNKIAVLITDGLPYATEYDSEEMAQNATVQAAKELAMDGVRLTVMGVGPKIIGGAKAVKEWVRDPQRDYFLFSQNVDCLKHTDMDKLVKMVCE